MVSHKGNTMISPTGIWSQELATTGHYHSIHLAKFISEYFPKDKLLIDVGCGDAYYLDYLDKNGFKYLIGIEGEILNNFMYKGMILKMDLSETNTLGTKGNLICLEVGEHVPKQYEQKFLDNIANWCDDKLILSWAIPWIPNVQGGEGTGHVNEQENSYIIDQMKNRGFVHLSNDTNEIRKPFGTGLMCDGVECWYFRNTLMCFKRG